MMCIIMFLSYDQNRCLMVMVIVIDLYYLNDKLYHVILCLTYHVSVCYDIVMW